MSEKSGSTKASKSKASTEAKPAASKSEPAASTKDASSASDSSTEKKPAKSGVEQSQKQTVSSSDVHYGYFSSVRTPAYRKGWDDIFGKKQLSGAKAGKNGTENRAKSARKTKTSTIKQPITLELDIAELPQELRAALNEEIRRKVKRRRVNYDKLDKAGAVRWNIVCEIER